MAEVLSPLSQPASTITMLHARPASSDVFQSPPAGPSYQQPQRLSNTPRSIYSAPSPAYRGVSSPPVQPYAFQSTPPLRQESRSVSASSVPHSQSSGPSPRYGHRHTSSASTVSSDMSNTATTKAQHTSPSPSKDDLFSGSARNSFLNLSSSIPDLSLTPLDTTPKSSPNRYRRTPQRMDSSNSVTRVSSNSSAAPSGSGMASVEHLYTPPPGKLQRTASDDLTITSKSSSSSESAKRYRRRSLNSLDTAKLVGGSPESTSPQAQRPLSHAGNVSNTIRPVSFHSRTSSNESAKPRRASATAPPPEQEKPAARAPQPQVAPVKVPIRGSSANPSPLSRSAITSDSPIEEQAPRPSTRPAQASAASPAAQHLAALSDKDLNKGMKSRLRRAFSFGATAELTRVSENVPPAQAPGEELDPEQQEIARKQEAAGIGAGIYSGQGGYTGSTDNLSISSTASSASMMLRKMGKGMKKGGRSLKGLFRPKSVIGVPAADGPIQPSLAQVSMVTVEAERQKVNVNAHPAEHVGGGTGFPKLEKNSMDAVRGPPTDLGSTTDRNDSMRKSIVGSDKDRADVLAAVKKGILKRHGATSPTGTPEPRPNVTAGTPNTHSPASSMPATPRDDRASRSMSSTTSDYFSGRLGASAAKSMPSTPSGSRNISFSPRIQFYDAWSSGDYDRRGDIATCNRLTPMLAQQIKEELNTFKMEMEVHELSKPHTHFF